MGAGEVSWVKTFQTFGLGERVFPGRSSSIAARKRRESST